MGLRYSSYIDPADDLDSCAGKWRAPGGRLDYYATRFSPASRMRKRSGTKFVTYGCRHCRTHISAQSQIMSKDYRGKTGDAYLMNQVVNVIEGQLETRSMITGDYLVCDILCHWCKSLVGWKYLKSERKDQRYKEGKYILELQTICRCD